MFNARKTCEIESEREKDRKKDIEINVRRIELEEKRYK